MNLLFFSYNAYPPNMGGIARITYNLINEFRSKGLSVFKLGHRKTQYSTVEDRNQYFLPNAKEVYCVENYNYMSELCSNLNIEIIICQNPLSGFGRLVFDVCDHLKIKSISCFHTSILTPILNYAYVQEYYMKKRKLGFVFELLKTSVVKSLLTKLYIIKYRKQHLLVVNKSTRVVLLCDGQVEELKQMCGYKHIDNAIVIPNCIEIPNVQDSIKEKLILWVGAFDCKIKRPDLMLCMWKMLESRFPDWKLLLLGDGPALVEMKALAHNLNLRNISFEGRVNPFDYYRKASVNCLTSTHESFSLVTVESQLYGVVPIAFDSFNAASMIIEDGKSGILVNAFDCNQYTEKLSELLSSPKMLEEIRDYAKVDACKFTNPSIYPQWKNLFDNIMNN